MSDLLPAIGAVGVLLLYSGLTGGSRGASAPSALERAIVEAGIDGLTVGRLFALSAGLALGAGIVVAGTLGGLLPGAIAAATAAWSPVAYVRSRRDRRRRRLREAWPDALATMIAGVRAGDSLGEICAALADTGPAELQASFRSFAATYRATGSFDRALSALRSTAADPIADRTTATLQLAHEVGGSDLVRVLRTSADFVREDLRIRREIEARWSWTVTAARVAAASPWIVLALMATRREAAAAYASPAGGVVILLGALATFLGYRLMLRAARLPDDRRLV